MSARVFSDRSILVTGLDHPHRFQDQFASTFPDALVRVGLDALLIEFERPRDDLPDLCTHAEHIAVIQPPVQGLQEGRCHDMEVRYDGVDLDSAAALLGIDSATLIQRHQSTTWRVAMIGFAPGFPYLVPESEVNWDLPRLASPRARVPAGSVAIAAGMSAIYPTAMPGGWHLIGTTDVRLFDPDVEPPALLRVNDLVRFRARR